jgi:hypothetical protein
MKNKRRDFLKLTSVAGLGIAGNIFKGFAIADNYFNSNFIKSTDKLAD